MSYKDLWLMLHEEAEVTSLYPVEKPEDNLTDSYNFEEHDTEDED